MSAENDIREDLAYVKALAEEGRDTPLVGGIFYVIWGGLISIAALIVYANDMGWVSFGPGGSYLPFFAAMAMGWVFSIGEGRRAERKPGAATLSNRTASSVWFAVGIFMTTFWISLFFVHGKYTDIGVPEYFLFNLMFPIGFGVYAIAFFATATAARTHWLRVFALISLAFFVLSLFFMTSIHQTGIGAIGTFLCAALPGIILMRREPSQTV